MSMTGERTGLLGRRRRRAEQNPEITTPPAGTVLPPHVRTGAPDVPVTSVTPALPPRAAPMRSTIARIAFCHVVASSCPSVPRMSGASTRSGTFIHS